jgi:hypothetical protein
MSVAELTAGDRQRPPVGRVHHERELGRGHVVRVAADAHGVAGADHLLGRRCNSARFPERAEDRLHPGRGLGDEAGGEADGNEQVRALVR